MAKPMKTILLVSGGITMLPIFQFILPDQLLQASNLSINDPAGRFYAQHWGLMAFVIGLLLVLAARGKVAAKPVLLAAAIEKLGLVAMVFMKWNEPALAGLHVAALFDAVCSVIFIYFLTAGKAQN